MKLQYCLQRPLRKLSPEDTSCTRLRIPSMVPTKILNGSDESDGTTTSSSIAVQEPCREPGFRRPRVRASLKKSLTTLDKSDHRTCPLSVNPAWGLPDPVETDVSIETRNKESRFRPFTMPDS